MSFFSKLVVNLSKPKNSRACFCFASFLLATSILTERALGTWNRSLVAGVYPHHILISYIIEGLSIFFIQFVEFSAYTIYFLSSKLSWNSIFLVSLVLLMTGINGVFFGLICSIAMNSALASFITIQFGAYPASYVSGESVQI